MTSKHTSLRTAICLLLSVAMIWGSLAVLPAGADGFPYTTQSCENVNLRKYANTTSAILARIQKGDSVTVLGESGRFFKVEYNGIRGYAVKGYIDGTATAEQGPAPTARADFAAGALSGYPYYTTVLDSVKLRKTAKENATVLLVVPAGAVVEALGESGDYIRATYDGKTGYLKRAYVNVLLATTQAPSVTAAPSTGAAAVYMTVRQGDTGLTVRALQEALRELGYYTGVIDSSFGSGTLKAVTAFQKKNKLSETGVADEALQKLLFEGRPRNTKGTRVTIKTLSPVVGTPAKQGKTGELVERIHKRLQELGYYTGALSDTYTKETVTAVKAFQKNHTIKATGIADAITQTVLFGASALAAYQSATAAPTASIAPPEGTLRSGDKGDGVKAMQQRLQQLGYYTGKLDGSFGKATAKALTAFQERAGLKADGVCGAQTIAQLFAAAAPYVSSTLPPLENVMPPVTQENVVIIQAGSRGAAVLYLQKRLSALGYYTSRQDGIYLSDDISAVRAFQKQHGLKVDGKAGYETQSLLYSSSAQSAAVNLTASTSITTSLRYGDTGAEVTTLQNRLLELGYLTSAADGRFGVGTKAALVTFQKQSGLVTDGVAGTRTVSALFADDAKRAQIADSKTLREGDVSAAVRDLQTRLIALGYLTGTADGKFGAKTSLALIAFQRRNSLNADGVAGAKTIGRLNSAEAKVAPGVTPTPKPSAPILALSNLPRAASVRYANWYDEVRAQVKQYPYATVYDFVTGLSWQVHMFSLGAHADSEPLTAEDTARMNQAFGGQTTWTAKAVWVVLSNGQVYMASTHNTPHGVQHITDNNFGGHLCIHFPRTDTQVASIGSYATSHQKAIDLGWTGTLQRAALGY